MTRKYGLHKYLPFGFAWLLSWLIVTIFTSKTQAQQSNIIPDNTLGAESSQVIGNFQGLAREVITGGAIRQINLFHSLQEFNVSAGREAYFLSPSADIQNIFARVTGANRSEILGRLGTFGSSNPNLFLINPNGIIFGRNASLDVQGSFMGTTANGVQFGNQGNFSATNPQEVPLLTINPSALFVNQINQNGGIINQSQAVAGKNLIGEDVTGLRVPDGKSLLLVGGNINLDGGSLRAYGGNVELAGLAAPGNVGLNIAGDNISLTVPDGVARANVSLNNAAEVNVRGANGGDIKIYAHDVNLAGESKLRAGIGTGLGTPNSQGGDIVIKATGTTTVKEGSFIANVLQERAIGKSGDININTGSLNFDNAYLNAINYGQGSGGNIFLQAKNSIYLSNDSSILGGLENTAVGNSGNIQIQADSLSITNSEINSKTYGLGNAGNINLNVRDSINLNGGVGIDGMTRIISSVNSEFGGKAGDIQIKTGYIQSTNGAFISSSSDSKGDGANITIDANNIAFDSGSYIGSQVFADGVGKGGNIRVNTINLSLLGGSDISTNVSGTGDAGNIFINARDTIKLDGILGYSISGIKSGVIAGGVGNGGNIEVTTGSLSLTNGAKIDTGTDGIGNAGNININVGESININGSGKIFTEKFGERKLPSNISSDVAFNGVGNGGNIRINTRELLLDNNGLIGARTFGKGDGGNIFIQASEKISLSNTNNIDFTQISANANDKAIGNGGNINIQARDLFLDNAAINSFNLGQGNAGNISIKVDDTLSLNNLSRLSTEASGRVGNGGNIDIQTGKLYLDNGSNFFASTFSKGNGGNILIQATDTVSFANRSRINSSISKTGVGNAGNIYILANSFSASGVSAIFNDNLGGQGNAGNISINTKDNVSFTSGSYLSNGISGEGNAGNIKIQAGGAVTVSGRSERNGSAIASGVLPGTLGNSGDIEILARSFELSNGADLFTLSNGKGNAGNIFITTLDNTTIKDSNIATSIGTDGNAGKIAIRAGGDVSISGKSALSSILYLDAVGKGGDIEIQGHNFSLSDGAVLYSATLGRGNAGNVKISTTSDINIKDGSQVRADTIGLGNAGNITLNAGGTILIDGMSSNGRRSGIATQVTTDEGFTGKGEGGDININARTLSITNHGALSSSSTGQGNAGDININAGTVNLDNEGIIAAQTNSTDGGNINLTATDLLLLRRNSNISTTAGLAKSDGNGGNININAKFIVAVPNENSDISANAFLGSGGNVEINSQGIFGIEARPKPTEKSDITASSELGVSGVINIKAPDTSSIINSFAEIFPTIDTNALIADSCIVRGDKRQENSFTITGSGAITPNRAGIFISNYTTGEVRGVVATSRPWKKGDPIIEPTGVYRLSNGQILLSRECSN
jgi:filamentous hemagglutinin family protein